MKLLRLAHQPTLLADLTSPVARCCCRCHRFIAADLVAQQNAGTYDAMRCNDEQLSFGSRTVSRCSTLDIQGDIISHPNTRAGALNGRQFSLIAVIDVRSVHL